MAPFQHERSHDELDAHEPMPSHSAIEHEAHRTHYPDHPERKNSPLYNRTHHELCIVQDTPCFVCGFKHSDATDHSKKTTETHHVGGEWAASGAIDFHHFKAKMKVLADKFAALAAIDANAANADPTSVIDSEANMLVLCSDHHRSTWCGVHHVNFPEWLLQAFAKNGFTFLEAVVDQAPAHE